MAKAYKCDACGKLYVKSSFEGRNIIRGLLNVKPNRNEEVTDEY